MKNKEMKEEKMMKDLKDWRNLQKKINVVNTILAFCILTLIKLRGKDIMDTITILICCILLLNMVLLFIDGVFRNSKKMIVHFIMSALWLSFLVFVNWF